MVVRCSYVLTASLSAKDGKRPQRILQDPHLAGFFFLSTLFPPACSRDDREKSLPKKPWLLYKERYYFSEKQAFTAINITKNPPPPKINILIFSALQNMQ